MASFLLPPLDRRLFLAGALAAATMGGRAAAEVPYDAVVAKPGMSAPPGRRFASLAEALAAAQPGRPFTLWLGRGEWTEKLTVSLPNVHLTGEHRTATRLVFAAAAGDPGPEGKPWGTFGSATLTVLAPGFRATNLTIENCFDPALPRAVALPSDRAQGQQAVALMLSGASDGAHLDRVDILGRQDTLLTNTGRTTFRDCLISGTVDFIFGAGTASFERCEIRSRRRADDGAPQGYVAAPSTPANQPSGLIDHCRLTREPGLPDRSVFLARPWRPTKRFADGSYGDPEALGMASFARCWMDAHIARERWTSMTYSAPDGRRVPLLPETARFSESNTIGPGARR